jgi:hypothetical protein
VNWHLISDSSLKSLSVPKRFVEYAKAYRDAAEALCQKMVESQEARTWPNASVVLMLSAHAVELFIKGIVLARDSTAVLDGHQIDELEREYRSRFPEPSFEWNVPFKTDYSGIKVAEIEALRKTTPVPSILYRYPVARGGNEWNGAFGFEAQSYMLVLRQLTHDFARISNQVA